MHYTHAPCVVIALAVAASSAASGAAPDLRVQAAQLLESSAKNTPSAIAASRAQYERSKGLYPRERRLDYVYALALMNQRKYHDVIPLVSGYLESAKRDLGARRLKISAVILDKRCAEALHEASALSQCFPAGPDQNRKDDYLETAEFLGAVFGYLELARPTAVDTQTRVDEREKVADRLGEWVGAFDQGRNAVAKQLTELQKQREAEQKQVTATVEQRRDQVREALEEDKKKAAGHAETAQASEQELRDAQRELNVLRKQLASLQSDRSRVAAQITTIQAQIQQLTTASSTFRDQTQPGNPRPVVANTVQTQTIPFDRFVQASSLALNLATLNKQAFDMDRKLLALQAQAANASGKGGEEIKSLEKSAAAIREAEKRAKIAEKQLRKPVPTSNARITATNAKMTNFATYAPFPFEQEKQRVLGWFAK